MKRAPLAIVALAVLVGGLLGLFAGQRWAGPAPAPAIGRTAPLIELPDLDGRRHRLVAGDGRPRLVNYWATWCAPCRKELPLLDAFAREQGDNGTQVVGIALDDAASVRTFLGHTPIGYPTLLEAASARDSSVALGNTRKVLPFSVLIGADGRILRQRVGAFEDAAELRGWAAAD